jgi:biopolymer transport protein ExbD
MTRQRLADNPGDISLPITPMLDMTFQLLTFFIFTYHPATAIEGQMDFALPAPSGMNSQGEAPDALPDDMPSTVTVVARASRGAGYDGSLSTIAVHTLHGEKLVDSLQALRSHLERLRREERRSGEVKLQAEASLKYTYVVQVMDACRQSGFAKVSIAAPPDQAAPHE